ncbi:MAG: carbon starvation protein A [Candidatus Omnitrophica bacterium]|nr:carbon starvation protein A [Candidatus Omnitrophota bacterium]
MPLFTIALLAIVAFVTGYAFYGKLLQRQYDLQDSRKTPASRVNDGLDYVPAKAPFLLGQHFSAIAAAGPIVGPILAGLWFGWLPALLWIVFGAIFIGAVHDFSALVGSVRHEARSIVDIVRQEMGRRAHLFFLGFVWLSLVYVITAFTDLTSSSFVDPELGGGVAASSTAYLFLAILMGLLLYRFKMPLRVATSIFIPLVGLVIWLGPSLPLSFPSIGTFPPQKIWNFLILGYCLLASVLPVWILLQPRGYLGGFFLYAALGAGVFGILLGGEKVNYPAFLGWTNLKGLPLFPVLFVTVACGACSGFHGIVSSGTTSKQIEKESDCHLVGYGGMLLEGLVAVIALSTLMLLAPGDPLLSTQPDRIYANGLSRFVEHFGVNREFARSFALLAFATFIYDTLDVATRLGRYVFQELVGWKGIGGGLLATLVTLALPAFCVSLTVRDTAGGVIPGWKLFWTIFGTSNQLLAALTLFSVTIWLKRIRYNWLVSFIPMLFMMAMTLWSLVLLLTPWLTKLCQGQWSFEPTSSVAAVLLALAFLLILEGIRSFRLITNRD